MGSAHLMLAKQGGWVDPLLSVFAFMYKRAPLFVICTCASFVSIHNSPLNTCGVLPEVYCYIS